MFDFEMVVNKESETMSKLGDYTITKAVYGDYIFIVVLDKDKKVIQNIMYAF